MKRYNKAIFTLFLSCLGFLWWSCKKDDSNSAPVPGPSTEQTTITGKVSDAAGIPLSGVSITVGGKSVSSSANGTFTITEIDASSGRIIVKGSKTGFFEGTRGLIPVKNGITKLELIMPAATADFNGNTSLDGNFLTNGTGIEIPANSLTGNGTFQAAIEHISPDNPDFERMIPGGDLMATDAAGSDRQLYSYGMLMVKLTDASGNEINLASGKTATIRMKIAASQLASAPASIPLWHFDEATARWKEEGSATRQGDQYVGTVSHFSSWNCDAPGGRSVIKGIVKDCHGNPLEGVRVRTGQKSVFTNASGQYETFVPAQTAFDVAVDYPELGLSSASVAVSPIADGATQTVADISVACPSGLSVILNCSGGNPLFTSYNISWGQGAGQSVYGTISGNGPKTILIPSNGLNANYTFQNALSGQTVSGSFTLPSQTDTIDKGTFNLCGDTSTQSDSLRVSLIMNGDGFNNQLVSWSGSPFSSFLIYSPGDSVSIFSSSSSSGIILTGSIPGVPRTGQFSEDDDVSISLTFPDGRLYFPDSLLSVNISQFGSVGQKVSGTFSGRFIRTDMQGGFFQAFISSGSFQFIRKPNQ